MWSPRCEDAPADPLLRYGRRTLAEPITLWAVAETKAPGRAIGRRRSRRRSSLRPLELARDTAVDVAFLIAIFRR